ncbi:hypothetical protein JCM11251_001433 [Rhodosporidiobolus azoricus]
MAAPYALNDDPFAAPDFLAGLEAAGYLQRLDTSEERITARYQHALSKMSFAAHSEEFLTRAGVKKVHRSTVQFFNETPVSDPFVHVLVGSLPPRKHNLVSPRGAVEESSWTPIGSPEEADGTVHFTMNHPGFWPVTVVFDVNHDIGKEDKYAGIRYDNESDDDPEAYLGASRSGRRAGLSGSGAYSSSRRNSYASGAGGAYGDAGASRSRSSRYASAAGGAGDDSDSSSGSSDEGAGGRGGNGRGYQRGMGGSQYAGSAYGGNGGGRSRRGSMAGGMTGMEDQMEEMGLGRSASRAGSMAAGRSASRASRRKSAYAPPLATSGLSSEPYTRISQLFLERAFSAAFPSNSTGTSTSSSSLHSASNPPTSAMPGAIPISRRSRSKELWSRISKFGNFDLLSVFSTTYRNPYPREVLINVPVPPEAQATAPKFPIPGFDRKIKNEEGKVTRTEKRGLGTKVVPAPGWTFDSNQVLTSKYNIITFLPRNLLEQFRRVANIFFLVLVILQFFPRFTTVSPGLSALPLIVVLFITAVKDGYEDLKRHQSDRAINNIKVLALRGTFHNPNLTLEKSRSLGLPAFIRNFFNRRQLVREAEEAEDEEREVTPKKAFWGKKVFRKPGKKGASKKGSFVPGDGSLPILQVEGQEPQEVPRTAPGGGTLQGALDEGNRARSGSAATSSSALGKKDTSNGRSRAGTTGGVSFEAPIPAKHLRLEGDYFANDEDALPSGHPIDTPGKPNEEQQPGAHLHMPHLPHPHLGGGGHEDRPMWVKESWEDLRVGDFVRLHGDESVPADLIICSTSEDENVCYVETKNLDGETNLKSRSAVPELTHLRTSSDIANQAKFVIRAEPPDVNMFTYNAAVEIHDGRVGKGGGVLKCPVNMNTMLLRGTVVRNTEWVIGVVVMSGRDTKIVMNSGGTPSKRSKVERQMNPMVFLNLFLLALMTIMCALADHYIQVDMYPEGAPWLFNANRSDDNPNINGVITWANALIAYQNIVPISLYISIEFVRLVQAGYIWGDDDMKGNGRRTTARSWNLSDDLGQIEYIFSDKTGTLTQNAMLFRQCSVGGKVYIGDEPPPSATDTTEKPMSTASSDDAATKVHSHTNGNGGDEKAEGAKVKLADQVLAPFHDREIEADLAKRDSRHAKNLYNFFCNLALCHTVLTSEEEDGMLSYKAQSPDEAALVQAAADVGFVFLGRDKDILRIQTPHDQDVVEFQLLNVLEFTSARKRMSVVLRKVSEGEGQGQLFLLAKGADNVIFERLAAGEEDLKKRTDKHLEDFANEGLRTLCLAYKPLDEAAYEAWERKYHEATTLIDNREAEIERVSDVLEQQLILLGATAIEDRLQDGVPEAIADLKRAGIKIWVATGDKLETAIAIGKTCNLLSRDMNLIIIKGGAYEEPNSAYRQLRNALERFFEVDDLADQLEHQPPDARPAGPRRSSSFRQSLNLHRTATGVSGVSDIVGNDNGQRPGGYGLVIDGSSLRHAFEEPYTKEILLELATRCKAVVCCRTSPLQKALIVRLVKDGLGSMCLAIGDGANDVSMIQAADIGVGVAGEEGLQAVNSSDYAMGQFRFLKRLLLVQGHWSYMRNSNMIVNFFYKEIIGIGVLFFFQFYCGYSATTVYEYTYLLFWNVFWTLVPVIFIGIFDRSVGEKVLMAVPELYEVGRRGKLFGIYRFSIYMLDGVYQSAIIYFFIFYSYDTTTARSDGYDVGMYEFSTIMAVAAVIAANFYNGLNTFSWNWWVLAGVLIGPILIVLYTAVYSAFPPDLIWTEVWGNNSFLWPSAYWWLLLLSTVLVSLAPRYFYRYIKENYFPTDIDILRQIEKRDPDHDWYHDPAMPQHEDSKARLFERGSLEQDNASASPMIGRRPASLASSRRARDSYQLGRVRTGQSMTHDMSTGQARPGHGSGYAFDEGVQLDINRYTSRGSERSAPGRRRAGSVRVAGLELNPFARTGGSTRDRSGSLGARLFQGKGGRKSTINEGGATPAAPTSPTRRQMRQGSGPLADAALTEDEAEEHPRSPTPGKAL